MTRLAHTRQDTQKPAVARKRRAAGFTAAGFTLVEVMIALSILLGFLAVIVPAMYRSQYGNAQSSYLNAGSLIIGSLANQFVNQRGPAFAVYQASTARAVPSCNEHMSGRTTGTAVDMGPVGNLQIFTQVTDGDAMGYNDPALYQVRVRPYVDDMGVNIGQRQMYEISVFYPNPTNPSGAMSCYSVPLGSNSIYRQAP